MVSDHRCVDPDLAPGNRGMGSVNGHEGSSVRSVGGDPGPRCATGQPP